MIGEIKWRITVKGILTGFVAGLLAVLYRLGIEFEIMMQMGAKDKNYGGVICKLISDR